MKHRHWPLTFIAFTVLGVISLVIGVVALTGFAGGIHPLLADDGTGIAMIATAIAFFLTGAFPLVLRRLAEREGA